MCQRKTNSNPSNVIVLLLVVTVFCASYNISSYCLYYSESPPSKLNEATGSDSVRRSNSTSTKASRRFHVALTAMSSPYSQWQSRIAYYTYKKVKDMPKSDMGEFTRILHSGEADNLMEEIPTFIVHQLPEGRDREYPPLIRPWAFLQWLELVEIEEEYIMMIEPDHIFVKPVPNLAFGDVPVGYKFFYIKPKKEEAILRKFYPAEKGPITDIDPTGNSPVMIKKHLLKKMSSTWVTTAMKMKDDPECDKRLGWVLEMYAYATAAALHGVRHVLMKELMVQPPLDTKIGKAYIIHFTYAMDYSLKGKRMKAGEIGGWRFDKRSYLDGPPPKNLSMPPPGVPETVLAVLNTINHVSATLPHWDLLP